MSFTLEVEFRALCMFVLHPSDGRVMVLMPDGRYRPQPVTFPDGEIGVPHVGHAHCDASTVFGVAAPGEFVLQLDGEQVEFGAAEPAAEGHDIRVPDADCFAPELELGLDALAQTPAAGTLLMRAILQGGRVTTKQSQTQWIFEAPFGKPNAECGGNYADRATWTATIPGDHLDVTLTRWRDGAQRSIRIAPATPGGVARVRFANICSDNPLEWARFGPLSPLEEREDKDFRWFYRLLVPRAGTYDDLLALAPDHKLPVPKVDRRGGSRTNPPGCDPVRLTAAF